VKVSVVLLVVVTATLSAPSNAQVSQQSPQDATVMERGRYVIEIAAACGFCHTPRGADGQLLPNMKLAGGRVIADRGFRAVVPNITPDPDTGIGRWSDAEIAAAIREGRRTDGTLIGPVMPIALYRGLSDHDLMAMVAYLRAVPPVQHAVTERSTYPFPLTQYGPSCGGAGSARGRSGGAGRLPCRPFGALHGLPHAAATRGTSGLVADRSGRCSFRGSRGRSGFAQHHVQQRVRHQGLDRRANHPCPHAGHFGGWASPRAADERTCFHLGPTDRTRQARPCRLSQIAAARGTGLTVNGDQSKLAVLEPWADARSRSTSRTPDHYLRTACGRACHSGAFDQTVDASRTAFGSTPAVRSQTSERQRSAS
jgi:hypothetical protein